MNKVTKKEWIGLCRTCNWTGRRTQDQATAQQEVDKHLQRHSQHQVRVLVTGDDKPNDSASVRDNVTEVWKMIDKRQK